MPMLRRRRRSRRSRRSSTRRRRVSSRAIRVFRNPRIRRFTRHVSAGRALGAFPNRKTVALRYIDEISLDAGSNTIAAVPFRIGGIQDPYQPFGGHQPMFHDIYSQIYEKYVVNYATIKMVALSTHIVNVATPNLVGGTNVGDNFYYNSNERACRMFIIKDSSTSDYPSNLNTLIEEGSKSLRWRYCPQTTNGTMPTVRMSAAPHKVLNLSPGDDTLKSLVSANPAAESYFICGVEGLGGNANPDNMKFQVIITYNVTYFDLKKNQAQN